MSASLGARTQERAAVRQIRPEARAGEVEAPKGTVLVTFLFLLAIAVMWGFMYLTLLRSA